MCRLCNIWVNLVDENRLVDEDKIIIVCGLIGFREKGLYL